MQNRWWWIPILTLTLMLSSCAVPASAPGVGSAEGEAVAEAGSETSVIVTDWWRTPQMFDMIFTPLTELDHNYDELLPALASGWEANEDFTEWTFFLRETPWHDGTPITAGDVEFTYNQLLSSTGIWRDIRYTTLNIEFTAVVDDFTIQITTFEPNEQLPRQLSAFYIFPMHRFEDAIASGEPQALREAINLFFAEQLIGTGAFRVVDISSDVAITLERNSDFFRGEPQIDLLIARNIPDPAAKIAALVSGDLDVSSQSECTTESLDALWENPDILVFDGWWTINNRIYEMEDGSESRLGERSFSHPKYRFEERWFTGEQRDTSDNPQPTIPCRPVPFPPPPTLLEPLIDVLAQFGLTPDDIDLDAAAAFPSGADPLQVAVPLRVFPAKDRSELDNKLVALFFLHDCLLNPNNCADRIRSLAIVTALEGDTILAYFVDESGSQITDGTPTAARDQPEEIEPPQVWFTIGNSHFVNVGGDHIVIPILIPWPPHG